jgi:hypothetical protein
LNDEQDGGDETDAGEGGRDDGEHVGASEAISQLSDRARSLIGRRTHERFVQ